MSNANLEERKEFIQAFIKQNPTCRAGELYDALESEWPSVSRGGHRSLVYRELDENERPWEKSHECPKCEVEAQGLDAIDATFGFRNMGDGKRRVQSWCRKCRAIDARKRRKAKSIDEGTEGEADVEETPEAEANEETKDFTEMSASEMKEAHTKAELKEKARALDLKVGGNKSELAERLEAAVGS